MRRIPLPLLLSHQLLPTPPPLLHLQIRHNETGAVPAGQQGNAVVAGAGWSELLESGPLTGKDGFDAALTPAVDEVPAGEEREGVAGDGVPGRMFGLGRGLDAADEDDEGAAGGGKGGEGRVDSLGGDDRGGTGGRVGEGGGFEEGGEVGGRGAVEHYCEMW